MFHGKHSAGAVLGTVPFVFPLEERTVERGSRHSVGTLKNVLPATSITSGSVRSTVSQRSPRPGQGTLSLRGGGFGTHGFYYAFQVVDGGEIDGYLALVTA